MNLSTPGSITTISPLENLFKSIGDPLCLHAVIFKERCDREQNPDPLVILFVYRKPLSYQFNLSVFRLCLDIKGNGRWNFPSNYNGIYTPGYFIEGAVREKIYCINKLKSPEHFLGKYQFF